jgi:formylmethanofuran dehydrogenase subunit E
MIKIVGKEEVEISARFCDKCEERITFSKTDDQIQANREYSVSLVFNFGYWSKQDGVNFELDFCDKCGEELMNDVLVKIGKSKSDYVKNYKE